MKKVKASKFVTPAVPMFGYLVGIDGRCVESSSSGERYGSWSESWIQEINRAVTKTDSMPDVVSTLDLPSGANALVVWATYSTGDSFGRSNGGSAEVFGIFTDVKSATELRDALSDFNTRGDTSRLNVTTSDGQVFTQYVPWSGYFESLDSVDIDVVTVF
jgi:hypothetical protein